VERLSMQTARNLSSTCENLAADGALKGDPVDAKTDKPIRYHYSIFYRRPGYADWQHLSSIKFRNSKTKQVQGFRTNGGVIKSYFSKSLAEKVRAGLVECERRRIQEIIDSCKNTKSQRVIYLDFTVEEYEALLEQVDSQFILVEEEWTDS